MSPYETLCLAVSCLAVSCLAASCLAACASSAVPSTPRCADPPPLAGAPQPTASPPPAPVPDPGRSIDIAITFDDLPSHGPTLPDQRIEDVHRQILDALAAHHVERAYGFINGAKLKDHPSGRRVLEMWRDAGHPLGNHTWAHSSVDDVGVKAFTREIDDNDALLAELVGDDAIAKKTRRTFRYPFLRQGRDRPTLDAVRGHLDDNAYRLAEVTIDFGDWAYNAPYVRCTAARDDKALEALRWDYLHRAVTFLRWSDAAARAIYGAPIPHILLLHSGSFGAATLDALLSAYEKAGARWITLDHALAHDAYRQDVRVPSRWGGSLLEQRIERDDPPHPPPPLQPTGLLEHLCR